MTRVVFVTPNQGRQAEVQRLLADIDVELSRLGPPVAEGLDLEATAASRAASAFHTLQRACFVENTAFEIEGLPELRGAALKDHLAGLGEAEFCLRHGGQRARVRVAVALAESEAAPTVFTGAIEGTIAPAPRGQDGWGWDRVFVPEGYPRTLGELGASKYLVNMRHAPYLDLADHLRQRHQGGAYEAHITVRDSADHALFAAVCDELGVKCVLIELPDGETTGQPMTASVHRGVLREVQDEVHALARELVARGFEVTRTKIEALPRNADWPESDADAAARPAGYYEFHVKLALPTGDAVALARADAAAAKHGARLSKNANSRARGETEHRFVTLRIPRLGRIGAEARFDALVVELEALGYPLRARIREYTVYDSHVAVDRGWLYPALERQRLARRDPLLRGWLRRARRCSRADGLVLRGSLVLDAFSPGARPARDVDYAWPGVFDAAACAAVVDAILAEEDPGPSLSLAGGEVIFAESRWPGWRALIVGEDDGFQVDLASGDPFSTPPAPLHLRDVGEVLACRAETLFAWKLHGLVERGRGGWRSKDLYDLWILAGLPLDPTLLPPAVALAFASRDTSLAALDDFLDRDGWGLSRGGVRKWRALARCLETVPDFLSVRRAVRAAATAYRLPR